MPWLLLLLLLFAASSLLCASQEQAVSVLLGMLRPPRKPLQKVVPSNSVGAAKVELEQMQQRLRAFV